MPFLNLDDNFAEHPKIHPLTDGAFRLHVSAMCYCARLKTDGKLPRSKVSGLTPHFRKTHVEALVRANGDIVPHLQLARAGWPAETDPDLLWLKPHLARLRSKVEGAGGPAIVAVRGVGYRIDADAA